jgi:transporter family protein
MDSKSFALAMLTMFSWGVGSIISKLAANRIGDKAIFFDIVGYTPAIIIYGLLILQAKDLFALDKTGIALAVIAGIIGSIGAISFYMLITHKQASISVPLTALYPALTVILALLFLKEKITLLQGLGVILSLVSIFLLSL